MNDFPEMIKVIMSSPEVFDRITHIMERYIREVSSYPVFFENFRGVEIIEDKAVPSGKVLLVGTKGSLVLFNIDGGILEVEDLSK